MHIQVCSLACAHAHVHLYEQVHMCVHMYMCVPHPGCRGGREDDGDLHRPVAVEAAVVASDARAAVSTCTCTCTCACTCTFTWQWKPPLSPLMRELPCVHVHAHEHAHVQPSTIVHMQVYMFMCISMTEHVHPPPKPVRRSLPYVYVCIRVHAHVHVSAHVYLHLSCYSDVQAPPHPRQALASAAADRNWQGAHMHTSRLRACCACTIPSCAQHTVKHTHGHAWTGRLRA